MRPLPGDWTSIGKLTDEIGIDVTQIRIIWGRGLLGGGFELNGNEDRVGHSDLALYGFPHYDYLTYSFSEKKRRLFRAYGSSFKFKYETRKNKSIKPLFLYFKIN